jgi:hypothetical protein
VRFPQAAAAEVAQLGFDYASQLPAAGFDLDFQDLEDLPLNANGHAVTKLRCTHHGSTSKEKVGRILLSCHAAGS